MLAREELPSATPRPHGHKEAPGPTTYADASITSASAHAKSFFPVRMNNWVYSCTFEAGNAPNPTGSPDDFGSTNSAPLARVYQFPPNLPTKSIFHGSTRPDSSTTRSATRNIAISPTSRFPDTFFPPQRHVVQQPSLHDHRGLGHPRHAHLHPRQRRQTSPLELVHLLRILRRSDVHMMRSENLVVVRHGVI